MTLLALDHSRRPPWGPLHGVVVACFLLQRGRRRGLRGASDVDMLGRLTAVPAGMWAALFWLIAGVAVITAAWVLLT